MNDLFQPHLRRFVLVFFYDILSYGLTWTLHLEHLTTVLHLLETHQFKVNQKKCSLGCLAVEYLGHVVSAKGPRKGICRVELAYTTKPQKG